MGKNRKLLAAYRLFFGGLGLSAIITEIVVLMHRGTFVPANFFSFFTVQSNIVAAVILLAGGAALARGRTGVPALVRGAVVLYMAVTGIIFALLLSGLDIGVLTAVPWDNTVLHYIMPIAVCTDWLIDRPARRVPFKRALLWLAYPLAYLAYTLVRGHFVGWYPYPFLNAGEKGYAAVAITAVVVSAVTLTLAWLLTRFARPAR